MKGGLLKRLSRTCHARRRCIAFNQVIADLKEKVYYANQFNRLM